MSGTVKISLNLARGLLWLLRRWQRQRQRLLRGCVEHNRKSGRKSGESKEDEKEGGLPHLSNDRDGPRQEKGE